MVDRMRTVLPYINRISGLILIVVGLYVAYYGYYEIRLFTANGSADDPVIGGAGRLQRVLAGWVYQHGGWPWLLVLGALIAAAAAMWTRRRRRRTLR